MGPWGFVVGLETTPADLRGSVGRADLSSPTKEVRFAELCEVWAPEGQGDLVAGRPGRH